MAKFSEFINLELMDVREIIEDALQQNKKCHIKGSGVALSDNPPSADITLVTGDYEYEITIKRRK